MPKSTMNSFKEYSGDLGKMRQTVSVQFWRFKVLLDSRDKGEKKIFSVLECQVCFGNSSYSVSKVLVRAGGVAQVVGHLPSKHEALSSNSSTAKKKTKQRLAI
jgi:hypothetical protein